MAPLRWAIVGAGKISHDFVTAVQIFPDRHNVVAVGSATKSNAEKFAKEHNIPKAYEGYEAIANDKEVDVVYIGNLNTQHYSTTKLMLEHGKPVLCEKPFTMNEKQTTELVKLARSKKLFLMEAVWSRCFPVYKKARELIDNGSIGDVMFANVNFGFNLQNKERITTFEWHKDFKDGYGTVEDETRPGLLQTARTDIKNNLRFHLEHDSFIRFKLPEGCIPKVMTDEQKANRVTICQQVEKETATNKQLGGGAILDLGIYILQFQQFVFRGLQPIKVVVNGTLTKDGVDGTTGALITYQNGKLASVVCSAELFLANEGIIVGTKGTLRIPHFWSPTQLITDKQTYNFDLPQSLGPFKHENSAGMFYEADEVKRCLEEGKQESPQITLDETVQLAQLMDTMRKEVGLQFPEDSQ